MARPGRKPTPVADRLFARIEVEDATGCWLWLGGKRADGYGRIGVGTKAENSVNYTHRVSYELHRGPIPPGLVLDHLCRNKSCCNPDHLEAVTQNENVRRGDSPVNAFRDVTHCKHGHEFTPENTVRAPKGRWCRECGRRRSREYNARNKANA